MKWKRTKEDGCQVYRSGDYEIRQNYEVGWQLSYQGHALNRTTALPSLRLAKETSEEHSRFN